LDILEKRISFFLDVREKKKKDRNYYKVQTMTFCPELFTAVTEEYIRFYSSLFFT
jgi:hypothetical protein